MRQESSSVGGHLAALAGVNATFHVRHVQQISGGQCGSRIRIQVQPCASLTTGRFHLNDR